VTTVLADRDEQIASLLGAGHSLLAELSARRHVVIGLLNSARALADQLRATMQETDDVLGPALAELDDVVGILNENKENLQASITGLQGYATAFGEAVASGPWFDAYIQNLTSPTTLAPVLSEVTQ
jgi:phospholipid/cholesterol/gamma-HCH transport system substrate-binding protein